MRRRIDQARVGWAGWSGMGLAAATAIVAAFALVVAVAAVAATGHFAVSAARGRATAPKFAFQPIAIQRIDLPRSITERSAPSTAPQLTWPVFTDDGQHLLFWWADELWITSLHGGGFKCLSCGLANDPRSTGEKLATPFPDGKRVFFGGFVQPGSPAMAVLQCSPSVVDCQRRSISPVDFSSAQPATIPPGGAVSSTQLDIGGAASAKLSQDGRYVGFSDVRSDSLEEMVVARLQRSGAKYVLSDPRVINPAGPTSASDPNANAWSDSSSLFEFKTFTDGGADATYVQVGGASSNPDVWSVNLATGRRTRLTSNADWDEDNAQSPNGKLLALWSNRTEHFIDWVGGLLPVREYLGAPLAVMTDGATSAKVCHGPMWILPSSGDDNARLLGEPIVDYNVAHVHVTNNLDGWPTWSPNGTMLALDTIDDETDAGAPYLLVAHFTSLKPTKPLRPVSSAVGSWAPAPAAYHGAMGYDGTVTLHGRGAGTVTVEYDGHPGVLTGTGQWSETYHDYSDNGKDFVNGTATLIGGALATEGTYVSHLTMTGADAGQDNADLTFSKGAFGGHATSTYDGNTISGPSVEEVHAGPCPKILPKEPALHVRATSLGHGSYRLQVTVSIAGAGANEKAVDTQPVDDATIQLGGKKIYTDDNGVAIVTIGYAQTATIVAGDTLKPTSIHLSIRSISGPRRR
jgi:hypothetical protein